MQKGGNSIRPVDALYEECSFLVFLFYPSSRESNKVARFLLVGRKDDFRIHQFFDDQ
jgi:hypothetical protein